MTYAIPEWRHLLAGRSTLHHKEMTRHFMMLGETGSGKTWSGVLPLARAGMRYRENDAARRAGMLIVDPKAEIGPAIREIAAPERIVNLASASSKIDFFEGVDRSALSAADVLRRCKLVFFPDGRSITREAFWETAALTLIEDLIEFDMHSFRTTGRGGWDGLNAFAHRELERIREEARRLEEKERESEDGDTGEPHARSPDRPAIPAAAMLRRHAGARHASLFEQITVAPLRNEPSAYFRPVKNALVLSALHGGFFGLLENFTRAHGFPRTIRLRLSRWDQTNPRTYRDVVAVAQTIVDTLLDELVNASVNLCPYEPQGVTLSISEEVEKGRVLMFSPPLSYEVAGDYIGKAAKMLFFETVLRRRDVNDDTRPLFYICDEFQRFITDDPLTGEQSFLDRCRSYKAICILATQGISSLSCALRAGGGRADRVGDVVDIIFLNTGNKLFFRSTDSRSHQCLQRLIPQASQLGKPHLLDVRPPSTLEVGECYFVLCDGSWGRKKVELAPGDTDDEEDGSATMRGRLRVV